VQISSLQSSQSLTIHLRTCPRHLPHVDWQRYAMSMKKVRRILSEVANRYLLHVVRFAQVANNPVLKVSTGGTGASSTSWAHPRLQINLTRVFL
jgi:hypothetical protein